MPGRKALQSNGYSISASRGGDERKKENEDRSIQHRFIGFCVVYLATSRIADGTLNCRKHCKRQAFPRENACPLLDWWVSLQENLQESFTWNRKGQNG